MIRFSMSDDMVSNEDEVSGFRRDVSTPFTSSGSCTPPCFLDQRRTESAARRFVSTCHIRMDSLRPYID